MLEILAIKTSRVVEEFEGRGGCGYSGRELLLLIEERLFHSRSRIQSSKQDTLIDCLVERKARWNSAGGSSHPPQGRIIGLMPLYIGQFRPNKGPAFAQG